MITMRRTMTLLTLTCATLVFSFALSQYHFSKARASAYTVYEGAVYDQYAAEEESLGEYTAPPEESPALADAPEQQTLPEIPEEDPESVPQDELTPAPNPDPTLQTTAVEELVEGEAPAQQEAIDPAASDTDQAGTDEGTDGEGVEDGAGEGELDEYPEWQYGLDEEIGPIVYVQPPEGSELPDGYVCEAPSEGENETLCLPSWAAELEETPNDGRCYTEKLIDHQGNIVDDKFQTTCFPTESNEEDGNFGLDVPPGYACTYYEGPNPNDGAYACTPSYLEDVDYDQPQTVKWTQCEEVPYVNYKYPNRPAPFDVQVECHLSYKTYWFDHNRKLDEDFMSGEPVGQTYCYQVEGQFVYRNAGPCNDRGGGGEAADNAARDWLMAFKTIEEEPSPPPDSPDDDGPRRDVPGGDGPGNNGPSSNGPGADPPAAGGPQGPSGGGPRGGNGPSSSSYLPPEGAADGPSDTSVGDAGSGGRAPATPSLLVGGDPARIGGRSMSELLRSAGGEGTAELYAPALSDSVSDGPRRAVVTGPSVSAYFLRNSLSRNTGSSSLWRLTSSDQTLGTGPGSPSSGLAMLGLPSGTPASEAPPGAAPRESRNWTSWMIAGSAAAALAAIVTGGAYFRGRQARS
jgi:hypothetical protein